jgi:hypothetical protein
MVYRISDLVREPLDQGQDLIGREVDLVEPIEGKGAYKVAAEAGGHTTQGSANSKHVER